MQTRVLLIYVNFKVFLWYTKINPSKTKTGGGVTVSQPKRKKKSEMYGSCCDPTNTNTGADYYFHRGPFDLHPLRRSWTYTLSERGRENEHRKEDKMNIRTLTLSAAIMQVHEGPLAFLMGKSKCLHWKSVIEHFVFMDGNTKEDKRANILKLKGNKDSKQRYLSGWKCCCWCYL